jgi:hypothetical protein
MIDVLLAVVLAALAGVHVYWGLGGVWPGHDRVTLARTVAGFGGIEQPPPPVACFVVAAALVIAAVWPLLLTGRLVAELPSTLLTLGGLALTLVFLGRGLAAYLPAWRRLTPELPFAQLDQRLYGPLCLTLGAGFALLTLRGWTS